MADAERPGAALTSAVMGAFGAQAAGHLRAGFERSWHPMLICDDQRRWVTANGAARELLNLTPEEVPWQAMDDITPHDGREHLDKQWRSFLTLGAAEGWYELSVPDRGIVRFEFSAIAHVLASRHLSVFIEPMDDPASADGTADHPPWAAVAAQSNRRPRLTKREREILSLIAGGGRTDDIAARLFVSPETVKSHVNNALGKLDAHTRAHAVAIGLVTGQIIWSVCDGPAAGAA
jgi:DNA-binding CsgD family transcriptional regulator